MYLLMLLCVSVKIGFSYKVNAIDWVLMKMTGLGGAKSMERTREMQREFYSGNLKEELKYII